MPAFATFALATTLSAFTTPPVEMAVGPTAARARAWEQAAAGLDTQAIARALGREGQLIGDVYRVSLPRSDLAVTVRGVTVRPGLALGSWMAFRPAGGAVVAHGDLVLLASEVNPVISRLLAGGLRVTALHNHLIGESPQVLYLHFWGRGEAEALARSLAEALRATRTPVAAPPAAAADPRLPADRLQR
ncbi:MAG TPA: DUF1259 domain-containing protein, partial [Vicinamibacterales bacterium]|nr:DUF1259 domain-containing protein [Vicinamibacterales bacterium]